jgi:hypothetical protein
LLDWARSRRVTIAWKRLGSARVLLPPPAGRTLRPPTGRVSLTMVIFCSCDPPETGDHLAARSGRQDAARAGQAFASRRKAIMVATATEVRRDKQPAGRANGSQSWISTAPLPSMSASSAAPACSRCSRTWARLTRSHARASVIGPPQTLANPRSS